MQETSQNPWISIHAMHIMLCHAAYVFFSFSAILSGPPLHPLVAFNHLLDQLLSKGWLLVLKA